MTLIGDSDERSRRWTAVPSQHCIHAVAGLSLILIVWLNILIWPIGFLGYTADLRTGVITSVRPNTPAADAGLQVGDQISRIYHRPWSAVGRAWNILAVVPPIGAHVDMTILRGHVPQQLALLHRPPDADFQELKIANMLLTGLCWVVGYLLGVVHRNEAVAAPLVALFWLALATLFGGYVFASYASVPLQTILLWIAIAILAPLAVYIHVWFPVRTVAPPAAQRARRFLFVYLLGAHLLLVGVVAGWHPRLIDLLYILSDSNPVIWLAAFVISGVMLFRAYHTTTVAHVRRQVRLIALACFMVAFAWSLAFFIPILLKHPLVPPDQRLNVIAGGIPLAYLISGTRRDLYRIDRVIVRLSLHLLTTLALLGGLVAVVTGFGLEGSTMPLWAIVAGVVLYQPIFQLMQRTFSENRTTRPRYDALNTTLTHLTTTLDPSQLMAHIVDGVRKTFTQPAFAFYSGDIDGANTLRLATHAHIPHLPPVIPAGRLAAALTTRRGVMTSRRVAELVGAVALQSAEEQAMRAPGVVLWCPMVHKDGYLLGVILLGPRGDYDPYRREDERALQRLLDAAVLALTNSATYTHQLQAEATIRQLYQHLQEVQDTTAAAIARELHDEVININIRLNIQSLQRTLAQVQDPALRDELKLVLESEHTVIETIRLICEQIHPTGLEDPLGLPAILRMQVQRARALWPGECLLRVHGAARPVNTRTQHAAMRITREALTNTMKHTDATIITVDLCYPVANHAPVELIIRDNGGGTDTIAPQPGHWGIRNMCESARAVGGSLTISPDGHGGLMVVFRFAAEDVATV